MAKLGRQVLRIAGVDLQFIELPQPGHSGSSNSSATGQSTGTSAGNVPSSPHHSNSLGVCLLCCLSNTADAHPALQLRQCYDETAIVSIIIPHAPSFCLNRSRTETEGAAPEELGGGTSVCFRHNSQCGGKHRACGVSLWGECELLFLHFFRWV